MRVADYIADKIYRQGTTHVFMMSGGGSIYLDDGVACHNHLEYIAVKNEATAPMMAEAYAKVSGGIGAVYVTTGPGGTNAITGVAEAWVDSAPIIIISGQVQKRFTSYNSKLKGIRTIGCQELNIIKLVESITKYSIMVNDPNSIKYHLEKALYLAKHGRPGPVWIDVPLDVQSAEIEIDKLYGFSPEEEVINIKDEDVERVLRDLIRASKPLVIAGQGIRQANAIYDLKKLLTRLDIPMVSSRMGQDLLPFSFRNNCGHGGSKGSKAAAKIMKEADLILSIGSRLSIPFIGENKDAFSDSAKKIVVDIDEVELKKEGIHIDVPIHGNAKDFLEKLNKRLQSIKDIVITPNYGRWMDTCLWHKSQMSMIKYVDKSNPINLYYFVSRLDALSSGRHVFVSSAGSTYFVCGQSLSFDRGQREITSGAFASMGLGVPLAIGSSVADPSAQILAVTGDGSLELNIQELKTISDYNLNIKLFVINNGGYASIRNTQDKLFNGRYINSNQASENKLLDFSKVADTFGLAYHIIDSSDKIDDIIKEVIQEDGPSFIEVVCTNKQNIINCY